MIRIRRAAVRSPLASMVVGLAIGACFTASPAKAQEASSFTVWASSDWSIGDIDTVIGCGSGLNADGEWVDCMPLTVLSAALPDVVPPIFDCTLTPPEGQGQTCKAGGDNIIVIWPMARWSSAEGGIQVGELQLTDGSLGIVMDDDI